MRHTRFAHALLRRAGVDIIRWPKRPDDSLMSWTLNSLIETAGINCVLDVGANTGQFGQLLRSLGYRGRIVSFEPSPSSFRSLSQVAARDSNWRVQQIALAAKPGTAELHTHGESVFDSLHPSLEPGQLPDVIAGIPEYADKGAVTVPLSTLAVEYAASVAGVGSPRVLLKSDTQGHDLDVIAGAQGLPREVLAVLVELSVQPVYADQPYLTRVIDRLKEENFLPIAFQPVTYALDELRVVEFDGLFLRQEGSLES
jgi:FkbM family methyltransferase